MSVYKDQKINTKVNGVLPCANCKEYPELQQADGKVTYVCKHCQRASAACKSERYAKSAWNRKNAITPDPGVMENCSQVYNCLNEAVVEYCWACPHCVDRECTEPKDSPHGPCFIKRWRAALVPSGIEAPDTNRIYELKEEVDRAYKCREVYHNAMIMSLNHVNEWADREQAREWVSCLGKSMTVMGASRALLQHIANVYQGMQKQDQNPTNSDTVTKGIN